MYLQDFGEHEHREQRRLLEAPLKIADVLRDESRSVSQDDLAQPPVNTN